MFVVRAWIASAGLARIELQEVAVIRRPERLIDEIAVAVMKNDTAEICRKATDVHHLEFKERANTISTRRTADPDRET